MVQENETTKPGKPTTALVFLGAAAVLLASIASTYWIGVRALKANRQLAAQRETLAHLERVGSTLKDAETGQRGYLLTGQPDYLEPYNAALHAVQGELKDLEHLAAKGALPASDVAQLVRLTEEKLAELEQTVKLKQAGQLEAALALVRSNRGKQLMDGIRAELGAMQAQEAAELRMANRRTDQAAQARVLTFLGTTLFNLGFLAWAYRQIAREMGQREAAQEALRQSHAQLEERVRARTAELQAANKELEAFGYSVSHDLRAPLRHVSSYIKLLEKSAGSGLSEQSRRQVRTIAEAAQRMGQLIDDLLVLSRIGRATLTESPVPLQQLVEEARQELAPEMAGRAIEWQIDSLPAVRGDLSLLRSALLNLLSNAVKYTRPRNPARIQVGCQQQEGEVVCFVRDNGAGFDMQFVDKLFGVFQRLHDRDQFEGTGIGLASVRRIIQRHGGRTWGVGEPDHGATFYFSFPQQRVL